MSVQLDEMFDEPPGVVVVVLSHAIEAAGWQLVEVSASGDHLVWIVDQPTTGPVRLEATVAACGDGARVTVTSEDDVLPSSVVPPVPYADEDHLADVIELGPRRTS